jgi:hypothetical protein
MFLMFILPIEKPLFTLRMLLVQILLRVGVGGRKAYALADLRIVKFTPSS